MRERAAFLLATVGGLGEVLPAPGTTVGSLLAATLFLLLETVARAVALPVALLVLAGLLPLSVAACGREAERRGVVDPGPVVLDEVAGQWLALTGVALVAPAPLGVGGAAVSFLLFRAFDVAKPWPISRLERLRGGLGIVADDLAAGAAAAAVHLLLASHLRFL
ncbi:MAG: phosphatidylglycerophosphatase A [Thermoanaerobaculaceae bacterium]|nr:phosphatidylglycerophosphatase A [Thermoanaerobaculaceae bacterium]